MFKKEIYQVVAYKSDLDGINDTALIEKKAQTITASISYAKAMLEDDRINLVTINKINI